MPETILKKWIPMSPVKGPPLPSLFGIYWPWYVREEIPPAEQPPEEEQPPPEQQPVADIRLENLTIDPSQATVGQTVNISMTAKNYGNASGSKDIVLTVNDKTSQQTVTLDPTQSVQVSFEAKPNEAGTYQVSVDGLTGSFTATSPTPPSYWTLNVQIVPYPPAPGWSTPIVSCTLTNSSSATIHPTVKLKLHESYYLPGVGLVERDLGRSLGLFEIPAGGSVQLSFDGTKASLLLESGGGQGIIGWGLWLEDDLGGKSSTFDFHT